MAPPVLLYPEVLWGGYVFSCVVPPPLLGKIDSAAFARTIERINQIIRPSAAQRILQLLVLLTAFSGFSLIVAISRGFKETSDLYWQAPLIFACSLGLAIIFQTAARCLAKRSIRRAEEFLDEENEFYRAPGRYRTRPCCWELGIAGDEESSTEGFSSSETHGNVWLAVHFTRAANSIFIDKMPHELAQLVNSASKSYTPTIAPVQEIHLRAEFIDPSAVPELS